MAIRLRPCPGCAKGAHRDHTPIWVLVGRIGTREWRCSCTTCRNLRGVPAAGFRSVLRDAALGIFLAVLCSLNLGCVTMDDGACQPAHSLDWEECEHQAP